MNRVCVPHTPATPPFGSSAGEPDERILQIVRTWPGRFAATRAHALGFRAEKSFDEIVGVYVEDELGGRIGAAT
jgi:hypothetical protein